MTLQSRQIKKIHIVQEEDKYI